MPGKLPRILRRRSLCDGRFDTRRPAAVACVDWYRVAAGTGRADAFGVGRDEIELRARR